MKLFCILLLALFVAGGVAAGQKDKWEDYRHLDCEDLDKTITSLRGYLIVLAYREASVVTYQMYLRKLQELRRVKAGICWDV